MSAFQLDTSGVVDAPAGKLFNGERVGCIWSDLTPFTQGYVGALFAGVMPEDGAPVVIDPRTGGRHLSHSFRFSDLAPATLARIIEDCALSLADHLGGYTDSVTSGGMFWRERRANQLNGTDPYFPPLTPYLGDDGKVYLRDAAQ